MLFNLELMIAVLAITGLVVSLISTFYSFFSSLYQPYKEGFSNKFKLSLLKLSAVSTTVAIRAKTAVVEVTDAELDELLEYVLSSVGPSKEISIVYLHSLGLYANSVLAYIESLGYTIVYLS